MALSDDLALKAIDHQIDLLRFSAATNREVQRLFVAMQTELVARLARSNLSAATRQRLLAVLRDIQTIINEGYAGVTSIMDARLGALAVTEGQVLAAGVNSGVGVSIMSGAVPKTVIRELLASAIILGAPSRDWWVQQSRNLIFNFTKQLRMGIALNETNAQLVARIRQMPGIWEQPRRVAEALVRTSVMEVANAARVATLKANPGVVKGFQQISTLDERTSDTCVIGSARVAPLGAMRKVFRRRYDGDVLVIATAAGEHVTVTPNHPVLTARGYLPAHEVKPHEDVLHSIANSGLCVVCAQKIGMPPTFTELADAAFDPAVAKVHTKGASAHDFHGDGAGGNGEVEIAELDRDLGDHLKAARDDGVADNPLRWVQASREFLALRRLDSLLGCGTPAVKPAQITSVVAEDGVQPRLRATDPAHDVDWACAVTEQAHGMGHVRRFGAVASRPARNVVHDAQSLEQRRDGGDAGAVVPCQLCGRQSVPVFRDKVVSVGREQLSGHVFNLQTDQESYIVNGLVVHNCIAYDGMSWDLDGKPINGTTLPFVNDGGSVNGCPRHWNCRSSLIPITKTWRELGVNVDEFRPSVRASVNGEVAANLTYSDWLKTKSEAEQDRVLGPGRAKLWRAGKISLRDLLNQSGRPMTLDQIRAKHGIAA